MPGVMIDGEWKTGSEQQNEEGRFFRPQSSFRGWISSDSSGDGSGGFPAASLRYQLYISWACPWAHRTAIIRSLKGLEDAISISVVAEGEAYQKQDLPQASRLTGVWFHERGQSLGEDTAWARRLRAAKASHLQRQLH